jgi:hypothetical protein
VSESFSPVPLVPDRRLLKRRAAMNDATRSRYARDLVRAAGMRTTSLPSDDALLLAYDRLARRHNGEDRRDG